METKPNKVSQKWVEVVRGQPGQFEQSQPGGNSGKEETNKIEPVGAPTSQESSPSQTQKRQKRKQERPKQAKQKQYRSKQSDRSGSRDLVASVRDGLAKEQGKTDAAAEIKGKTEVKEQQTPKEKFDSLEDSVVRDSVIAKGFQVVNDDSEKYVVGYLTIFLFCFVAMVSVAFAFYEPVLLSFTLPYSNSTTCMTMLDEKAEYSKCLTSATIGWSNSSRMLFEKKFDDFYVEKDYPGILALVVHSQVDYEVSRIARSYAGYPFYKSIMGFFRLLGSAQTWVRLGPLRSVGEFYYAGQVYGWFPDWADSWFFYFFDEPLNVRCAGVQEYYREECWYNVRFETYKISSFVVPLILVSIVIVYLVKILVYHKQFNYEKAVFVDYLDFDTPLDLRKEAVSVGDLKTKDPVFAKIRHYFGYHVIVCFGDPLNPFYKLELFNPKRRIEEYVVSLEMYTHILCAKFSGNVYEPDVVRANIDYAANHMQSININRLTTLLDEKSKNVVQHTSNLAYMAYLEYVISYDIHFQHAPAQVRNFSMVTASGKLNFQELPELNKTLLFLLSLIVMIRTVHLFKSLLTGSFLEQLFRTLILQVLRQ